MVLVVEGDRDVSGQRQPLASTSSKAASCREPTRAKQSAPRLGTTSQSGAVIAARANPDDDDGDELVLPSPPFNLLGGHSRAMYSTILPRLSLLECCERLVKKVVRWLADDGRELVIV